MNRNIENDFQTNVQTDAGPIFTDPWKSLTPQQKEGLLKLYESYEIRKMLNIIQHNPLNPIMYPCNFLESIIKKYKNGHEQEIEEYNDNNNNTIKEFNYKGFNGQDIEEYSISINDQESEEEEDLSMEDID